VGEEMRHGGKGETMSTWKRWAIGVVALLITGAFLITAVPGGAATGFTSRYVGPYKNVTAHRVDTGMKGLSVGDQDIGALRLYKHGKQRGALYFHCAFTTVRRHRVRQLCQTDTDIYAHGEIIAVGLAHSSSFLHPITGSSFVLHITGGGGDFRRLRRGTVTVKFWKRGARVVYRVRR
jgi:hypothetical protein